MTDIDKNAVVEDILVRAAEQAGDITQPVMALFYQRFPQARESFEHHAIDRVFNLEGEMVQQAIYCLMVWFQSRAEVEILLNGSVPHHNDTLGVPPEFYRGLLQATADIIRETIPVENNTEQAIWQQLSEELSETVDASGQYITLKTLE